MTPTPARRIVVQLESGTTENHTTLAELHYQPETNPANVSTVRETIALPSGVTVTVQSAVADPGGGTSAAVFEGDRQLLLAGFAWREAGAPPYLGVVLSDESVLHLYFMQ